MLRSRTRQGPVPAGKELTVEILRNGRKLAFTVALDRGEFYATIGDVQVYEENTMLGGEPFRLTAEFIVETDARLFLEAKYGRATHAPHFEAKG